MLVYQRVTIATSVLTMCFDLKTPQDLLTTPAQWFVSKKAGPPGPFLDAPKESEGPKNSDLAKSGSQVDMGMSENGVSPQWNSHLVGIMISKTIGFFGVHNIFRQTHIAGSYWNPFLNMALANQPPPMPVQIWSYRSVGFKLLLAITNEAKMGGFTWYDLRWAEVLSVHVGFPLLPLAILEMAVPPCFRSFFSREAYIILYYIIFYYIILYYIVLYYIILCYLILYYIILYYIMLYYIILYYLILYYIILYYIILYYIIWMSVAPLSVCIVGRVKTDNHEIWSTSASSQHLDVARYHTPTHSTNAWWV